MTVKKTTGLVLLLLSLYLVKKKLTLNWCFTAGSGTSIEPSARRARGNARSAGTTSVTSTSFSNRIRRGGFDGS